MYRPSSILPPPQTTTSADASHPGGQGSSHALAFRSRAAAELRRVVSQRVTRGANDDAAVSPSLTCLRTTLCCVRHSPAGIARGDVRTSSARVPTSCTTIASWAQRHLRHDTLAHKCQTPGCNDRRRDRTDQSISSWCHLHVNNPRCLLFPTLSHRWKSVRCNLPSSKSTTHSRQCNQRCGLHQLTRWLIRLASIQAIKTATSMASSSQNY